MPGVIRRAWSNLLASLRPRPATPHKAKPVFFRPELSQLEDRVTPVAAVLRSFNALGFPNSGGSVPPDTTAAVGPTHVVEAVNSAVGIYSKATGARTLFQPMNQFVGLNSQQANLFDPVVVYDAGVQRFYVLTLEVDFTNETSSMILAVSNTPNPMQGFTERQRITTELTVNGNDFWGDFPKVGFNREAIVITLNMFPYQGAGNGPTQVIAVRKSQLLDRNNGTAAATFSSQRANNFTMAGAVMHGAPANSPLWFAQDGNGSNVRITRMTNILSNSPVYTDFTVPVNAYGNVPVNGGIQPGGTGYDAGDNRMSNAEWRANRLVVAHTIGVNNEATVRWYEFSTAGATPTVFQQGNIDPGAGIITAYPSISISPGGFLGMTFMRSSATQGMSMYVTGRAPSNPRGTMQAPVLVRNGAGAYSETGFGGGPLRAGDYSATSVDPVNGTFWSANEYATNAATNNWGTWIANFRVPGQVPGPGPGPGPSPAPGRFVRNFNDNNETTDQAANLGTLQRGVNTMPALAITRTLFGLPDYDAFSVRSARGGAVIVNNTVTAGQPLMMSLFRRVGNDIVLIGRVATGAGGTGRLGLFLRPGDQIFVLVQGVNLAPGVIGQGNYNLSFLQS